MANNREIVKRLAKMKSVDLSDPIARSWAINNLSTRRNRTDVAAAVNAYVNSHEDKVINSELEREKLAVMITRQGFRSRERVPLARATSKARGMLRNRKYNFKQSSGKGIRKFDSAKGVSGWRGYRIADARTKFDADRLAKFLRRNTDGRVRVVQYQADKKTHYTVYSDRLVSITNKNYIDGLKKYSNDPSIRKILKRVDNGKKLKTPTGGIRRNPPNAYSRDGTPILTTKKRLPEIGLRMRVV